MKRVIPFILAIMMILPLSLLSASAVTTDDAVAADIASFFPEGKIGKVTDLYLQARNYDEAPTHPYRYQLWATQPDDIWNMFTLRNELDNEDLWEEKHGWRLDFAEFQLDLRVDGGDWQYQSSWDHLEYQDDLPDYMLWNNAYGAITYAKSFQHGAAAFDVGYAEEDNCGCLKPAVVFDGENSYFDVTNHTIAIRARYVMKYSYKVADGEDESEVEKYLYSDWSDELSIGKNGNQKEPQKPTEIIAPLIKDLQFEEGHEGEDDSLNGYWQLYVEFSQALGEAERYYSVYGEGGGLYAVMEYRVNKDNTWGEWKETSWGNADWLTSGKKSFYTEGAAKGDMIEFRCHLANSADENLQGKYSVSLFANAGDYQPDNTEDGSLGGDGTLDGETGKKKCKVCGICPIQPLGICLFIWIAIILLIIIIIVIIIIVVSKSKKKDKKEDEKKAE